MNIVPSIELIPAKYGVGTLLTQVPMDVSGDFSVTRATAVSTRYNSAGLIETIPSGIPRLDYYTSSGTPGCPALLVEPSAQNLVFIVTGYSLLNATTGSLVTSPEGTSNAITFVESSDAVATNHQITTNAIPFVSGSVYTFSCFLKAGVSNRSVRLALPSVYFVGSPVAFFDLSSGTILSSADCTSSIQNYGNGWYRCVITATSDASGSTTAFINLASGATRDYVGNGSGSILAYGSQIETGSVATSYIPTTTGSVTRDADVINKTGVSGLIGQTQGTIYAEFRYLGNPIVRAGFVFLRQTGYRGLSINFAPSDTPSGIVFISRNNSGTTSIQLTNGLTLGAYYKIAIAYDAGGTAAGGTQASGVTAYVNGSPATVSVGSLRVPDANLNELRLYGANSGDENEVPNGNLRAVAIYKTRLPNYLLESATSQIQSYSALASSLSYTVV